MITISHYLVLAAILFVIGIFGVFLNKKNIIIILMSIELMLLSVNINLVSFSSYPPPSCPSSRHRTDPWKHR